MSQFFQKRIEAAFFEFSTGSTLVAHVTRDTDDVDTFGHSGTASFDVWRRSPTIPPQRLRPLESIPIWLASQSAPWSVSLILFDVARSDLGRCDRHFGRIAQDASVSRRVPLSAPVSATGASVREPLSVHRTVRAVSRTRPVKGCQALPSAITLTEPFTLSICDRSKPPLQRKTIPSFWRSRQPTRFTDCSWGACSGESRSLIT